MSPTVRVPRALRSALTGQPDARDWLAALPDLVAVACERWDLAIDLAPRAPAWHGNASLVVPVRREGEALVLKVGWPHLEARDEAVALRRWAGEGAVRLLGGDGGWTLLLERLDSTHDLQTLPVPAAIEVVGSLLRRLHVPAPPGLHLLSDDVRRWLVEPAGAGRRGARAGAAAAGRRRARGAAAPGVRPARRHAPAPRPALRQRAGGAARAVAGDRPQAAVGRPGLRGGAAAVEPVGRGRGHRRPGRRGAAPARDRLRRSGSRRRAGAGVGRRPRASTTPSSAPGRATPPSLAVHTTILGAVR
ncbi:hypothetical protein GCM10025868_07840 [Angustibacter aerolatus]|uniref:Aminoglycoside phosphotransferase domain-containing protein n=1 Tax=Angustibacter aerolatus TaxID=1162965 RepID=A0ABQ6JEG7_9ACTN|nr:aminoglycoside phosphotransferase family protein [Angustibacter aerolatus]GMA85534.1 hypothetical protein GCM10025868_07840 [Angustibacter aerolatus]